MLPRADASAGSYACSGCGRWSIRIATRQSLLWCTVMCTHLQVPLHELSRLDLSWDITSTSRCIPPNIEPFSQGRLQRKCVGRLINVPAMLQARLVFHSFRLVYTISRFTRIYLNVSNALFHSGPNYIDTRCACRRKAGTTGVLVLLQMHTASPLLLFPFR